MNRELNGKPIERKYQDTVFRDLFKNKKYFLQLYKTFHQDSSLTEDDLEWIAIENVITSGLFNDVAYLAGNVLMIFLEHQSTIDGKIPLRFLFYYADSLMRYLKQHDISLHDKTKIVLPAVEFYLVYSGDKEWNVSELRLSDSFFSSESAIELVVKVIRRNDYIGSVADDYLNFVFKVKEFANIYGNTKEGKRKAVIAAIDYCIANNILKEYFKMRTEEVTYMFIEELTQEDIYEIRRKEGRTEEKSIIIFNMLKEGLSLDLIAKLTNTSLEEIQHITQK